MSDEHPPTVPSVRSGPSGSSTLAARRSAPLPIVKDEQPDHSQRVMSTYLVGVYLAVNAIRDGYLLVEGPDCVHMKTQFVQGNHDWLSTLTSVSGFHRVANTALHPVHMARSREDRLRELLLQLAGHPATGGVLLTSMPMAFITGADYERLCGEAAETCQKTIVHIPGKSLSGDWLDGYAETLLALARRLPLQNESGGEVEADPKKVGIVGYLYDRNEGDHRANIQHLREMLARLGLDPVSIWLEGQDFADLGKIGRAGTILSFPYGRRAAQALARRTRARLIECELPFGLEATERWLQQIGRELGVERQAQELIDQELATTIPSLEWIIPYVFQGRRIGFVGDPVLAPGMREIAEMLGARLSFAAITNTPVLARPTQQKLGEGVRTLAWPTNQTLRTFLHESTQADRVSLLVTNGHGVGMTQEMAAWVEFGFPSMYAHALYDRPFLGFRGFLAFVDLLTNAVRHFEVLQAGQARRGGP